MDDKKNKMLTIIAPCYNGESYIKRFLNSVLAQTYSEIELIVVNDGSTDSTEDILTSYEKLFANEGYLYTYLKQDNQGIGGTLNNALKYVRGKYLTWFGTDDYALPTYAEELVNFLEENSEFAVVRCEGFLVDEVDTSIIKGKFSTGNNDKHNPYLFENAILERDFHFGYSVLRMDVFDEVNPLREIYPSRQGQNWQLLLPIFYEHKSAFYEKPLYCVVDNTNSVSRTPHKSYEKTREQNNEYERILINVLNSMDIPDRQRYLEMVKLKYIRRRMCAAIDFKQYDDAITEYKMLKSLKKAERNDTRRYLRAKFWILDWLIRKVKK